MQHTSTRSAQLITSPDNQFFLHRQVEVPIYLSSCNTPQASSLSAQTSINDLNGKDLLLKEITSKQSNHHIVPIVEMNQPTSIHPIIHTSSTLEKLATKNNTTTSNTVHSVRGGFAVAAGIAVCNFSGPIIGIIAGSISVIYGILAIIPAGPYSERNWELGVPLMVVGAVAIPYAGYILGMLLASLTVMTYDRLSR